MAYPYSSKGCASYAGFGGGTLGVWFGCAFGFCPGVLPSVVPGWAGYIAGSPNYTAGRWAKSGPRPSLVLIARVVTATRDTLWSWAVDRVLVFGRLTL